MKKIFFATIFVALGLTSCKKEEITNEPSLTSGETQNLIALGSATTVNNETVVLYASNSQLKTGYNKLYVTIKNNSGITLPNAAITFSPLMNMGMMSHASPTEQPFYNESIGKYEGVVVFTMPSTLGTWTLDVMVNGSAATFDLTIADASTKVVGSYAGADGNNYVITLVPPIKWNVGLNDVEIMIHKNESGISFPPINDLNLVMTPEMVSMGHGSPNNISPTSIGNGHYKGVVNLTMTGDWRFHFELSQNGTLINSDAYLDILF